ncbi:hypothetical protein SNOG_12001 [Parastagonospora nodorum SN15]|uniref:Peptidase S54 rhomboid domain-containing protein n=1 Tax=Phaeosphaeria nodorum (strain SN15 / ATCC MYA-4574 / FGSC 10173) TaxID=321614 RepID=Q0U8B3_PHANO|nr:hypothetical protein SNOG_12001 [Parastagonospora nodorum SN15]EAT80413.2 hypothetical protein SNOG_12001 [Parastagonospora nodorum SN15]
MIFNLIALTPLLERFESEFGTLVTLALFTGRKGVPGYAWKHEIDDRQHSAQYQVASTRYSRISSVGPYKIPTWTTPLILALVTSFIVPNVSLIGHLCGAGIGYLWASGYIKFLVPHEKILRWVETKLNLLGRLPHYVSVDQKTYGRYGVLPTSNVPVPLGNMPRSPEPGQRLGP